MSHLKLYGMKAAYDEIITTAVKRQNKPQQIVGDLLNAEISEKQARSIRYQMRIAKLPLAKEVDEFSFENTPVNETLVRMHRLLSPMLERIQAQQAAVGEFASQWITSRRKSTGQWKRLRLQKGL